MMRAAVFPGSLQEVSPEAVEATLAPGEHLTALTSGWDEHVAAIVRPPSAGSDWTVFLYGNGMTMADTRPIRDALGADGRGVICADYLGFGLSGSEPSENGCHRTAETAFAAAMGTSGARVAVVGWSLGTVPALGLAVRHRLSALVLISPLVGLAEAALCMLSGGRWWPVGIGPFSSLAGARQVATPTLLIAGSLDRLTPPSMADALRERLRGPTQLEVLPGADHTDILLRPEAWQLVRSFLDKNARVSGAGEPS